MEAFNQHIAALKIAFEHLSKGKYWLYLIPSFVVSLLFAGLFGLFSLLTNWSDATDSVPLIGSYVASGLKSAIQFSNAITTEVYKFFILTLLSPISCLLSEKVDNETTGSIFSGGITRILTDIVRAIFIVIVALFFNFLAMGIWWFLAWITGFHLLDEVAYFLIASFFIGFSFYDFSLERYGIGMFGSWNFGYRNTFQMLFTGMLFSLIFAIPLIGIISAPFIVTIVSTIVYLFIEGKNPSVSPASNASTHE